MFDKLEDSPDIFADSPNTATTTSDFCAAATASSSISCGERLSISISFIKAFTFFANIGSSEILAPLAWMIFTLLPPTFCKP
ncbi:hypothetical protein D3C80_1805340 [compost metagenome]